MNGQDTWLLKNVGVNGRRRQNRDDTKIVEMEVQRKLYYTEQYVPVEEL